MIEATFRSLVVYILGEVGRYVRARYLNFQLHLFLLFLFTS